MVILPNVECYTAQAARKYKERAKKNNIRKENNMQTAKQCKSQTQQSSAHNLTVILTRRQEL